MTSSLKNKTVRGVVRSPCMERFSRFQGILFLRDDHRHRRDVNTGGLWSGGHVDRVYRNLTIFSG